MAEIKSIEEIISGSRLDDGQPTYSYDEVKKIAVAYHSQFSLSSTSGGWIDCSDKKPSESGYVFIWTTAGCDKVWYNKEKDYFGTYESHQWLATHWQPLPEKPKQ